MGCFVPFTTSPASRPPEEVVSLFTASVGESRDRPCDPSNANRPTSSPISAPQHPRIDGKKNKKHLLMAPHCQAYNLGACVMCWQAAAGSRIDPRKLSFTQVAHPGGFAPGTKLSRSHQKRNTTRSSFRLWIGCSCGVLPKRSKTSLLSTPRFGRGPRGGVFRVRKAEKKN